MAMKLGTSPMPIFPEEEPENVYTVNNITVVGVDVLAADEQLRTEIEALIRTLMSALSKISGLLHKANLANQMKQIEKVAEQAIKRFQAKHVGVFKKIFMKLALIFAIAIVIITPMNVFLAAIIVAVMTVQLLAQVQTDITGKRSFLDSAILDFAKLLGGGEKLAMYLTIALEVALVIATLGGAGAAKWLCNPQNTMSLMQRAMNLFQKLFRASRTAQTGGAAGSTTAAGVKDGEALAKVQKFMYGLSLVGASVQGGLTINESVLKRAIAKIEVAVAIM